MRMTLTEFTQAQAAIDARRQGRAVEPETESPLHGDILDYCAKQWPPWVAFHGSMAHPTWRTPGEPDFIIMADGGRTFYIEAKTRTGKLSTRQLGVQLQASKLGHTVHVVRSLDEFRKVVDHE